MTSRNHNGHLIHVMVQGKPVAGGKAIAARQAKSQATRNAKVTLDQPPWMAPQKCDEEPSCETTKGDPAQ